MQLQRQPMREDKLFRDPRVPLLFPRLRFQHGPPQIPEVFILPSITTSRSEDVVMEPRVP